jgi:hypothetical protein
MPMQYALILSALTLQSGCSVNGSYVDPNGDDVAKVRLVAINTSATLDWYNGKTCEGKTTGILNNMFMSNTKRRADMKAPLDEGEDFLEIAVTPDEPVYLYLNTSGYMTVCSIPFNFVPKARAEYEARFFNTPGKCNLRVSQLIMEQGQLVKMPVNISKALPPCATAKK